MNILIAFGFVALGYVIVYGLIYTIAKTADLLNIRF